MPNGGFQPQNAPAQQQEPPPPSSARIEQQLIDPSDQAGKSVERIPLPFAQSSEPYIIPSGRSQPNEWARDSYRVHKIRGYPMPGAMPGPWAPQVHEARELVRDNALFFIKNGSRTSALSAARMVAYNDKYWKDYLNAKHLLAQMSHDQYIQEEKQFLRNNRQEFELLADAFEIYKNDKGQLKQALLRLTDRFDDPELRKAIESQGVERAEEIVNHRVNRNEVQLQIAEQRARVEAAERTKAREEGLQRLLTPPPADPASDPTAPPSTVTPALDKELGLPNVPRVNPQVNQWAQQFQMTDRTRSKMPASVLGFKSPELETAVENQAAAMDTYMNGLIFDPNIGTAPTPKERADELIPLIRAKNPAMANAVENFLAGTRRPSGPQSDKEPDNTILRLVGKINPDLTLDWARRKADTEMANRRAELMIGRRELIPLEQNIDNLRATIGRNVKDWNTLITIADNNGGSLRPVVLRWERWLKREIAGDPEISAYDAQRKEVQRDAASILNSFSAGGTGRFTVYAQKEMEKLIAEGATAAQIKRQANILKWDYENQLIPMVREFNRVSDRFFPDGKGPHQDVNDILETLRAGREPLEPPPPGGRKIN